MWSLLISNKIIIWSVRYEREGNSFLVNTWYHFLIIELLGRFWYFLLVFSTGLGMLEVLQIYCWLTLIPRFETTLIKKLLKIFAILYSFLINWSFSLRILHIYSHFTTRTCAYQGVRNVRFSENLASFVFLKHLFSDSSFHLITDELHIYFFACYKSI